MTKNKKQFFTLVILNKDDLVGFKYVYSLINKKDFFEVFVVDGDSKDGSVDYFIKKKIKYKILKKRMPWSTVATWFLWRSLDPIPVKY